MSASRSIGRVAEIRRYPVKSMLGEVLAEVQVESRGFRGDRVCAFLDQVTGKLASAKLPHRWSKLLTCQAIYREADDRVEVMLPGETVMEAEMAADKLSRLLGREVRVMFSRPNGIEVDRADPDALSDPTSDKIVKSEAIPVGIGAPEGGFFDALPIHFITSATLKKVGEHALAGIPEPARFRPNIVIETEDCPPLAENDWIGASLAIGELVKIEVVFPTPRCAVPALAHGNILPDLQLIKAIGELNKIPVATMGNLSCVGAYGKVAEPGLISVGDIVHYLREA